MNTMNKNNKKNKSIKNQIKNLEIKKTLKNLTKKIFNKSHVKTNNLPKPFIEKLNDRPNVVDTIKTINNSNTNNDNQNIEINESISFDFFVNMSLTTTDCEKMKVVIAKSINVCDTQVTIEKCEDISVTKARTRICGTVILNSYEIEATYVKFSGLISQRTLSEMIKNVFELKEQPRVSRFYIKCSNSKISRSYSITESPLDNIEVTEKCSSENKIEKLSDDSDSNSFDKYNVCDHRIYNYEPLYINYMLENQCAIL